MSVRANPEGWPLAPGHDHSTRGRWVARAMELFRLNEVRLAELAQRAFNKGYAAADIAIVCVEVDSSWRNLVDALMPGYDWQAIRDRGKTPVARGRVLREGFSEEFSKVVPDVAWILRRRPAPGQLHAVVCVEGGACVFPLIPRGEPS